MKETPVDPSKIRGKYVPPPPPSTDILADPIDNPPEKSFKKDLPKSTAKFEKNQIDNTPIDLNAIILSIALLFVAGFASFIPIRGLSYLVAAAAALASLIFNLKNSHLQAKKFSRFGINPLHIITAIDILIIIVNTVRLFLFLITLGNL